MTRLRQRYSFGDTTELYDDGGVHRVVRSTRAGTKEQAHTCAVAALADFEGLPVPTDESTEEE
jgi:hypothetical protein